MTYYYFSKTQNKLPGKSFLHLIIVFQWDLFYICESIYVTLRFLKQRNDQWHGGDIELPGAWIRQHE